MRISSFSTGKCHLFAYYCSIFVSAEKFSADTMVLYGSRRRLRRLRRRRRIDFFVSTITQTKSIQLIWFLADSKIWVRGWTSSIIGPIAPGVGPVGGPNRPKIHIFIYNSNPTCLLHATFLLFLACTQLMVFGIIIPKIKIIRSGVGAKWGG